MSKKKDAPQGDDAQEPRATKGRNPLLVAASDYAKARTRLLDLTAQHSRAVDRVAELASSMGEAEQQVAAAQKALTGVAE